MSHVFVVNAVVCADLIVCLMVDSCSCLAEGRCERQRTLVTKIHANLVLQACISFLRSFSRKRSSKETLAISYPVL